MTMTTDWHDLVEEIVIKFPETCRDTILSRAGDMTALMAPIAAAHELPLAEAAEVVTFRLPQYLEPERLSA